MLRPTDLTVDQYAMALKPTLGYEQQLHVSLSAHAELGTLEFVAANSGTYTANAADVAFLGSNPRELLAVLDTEADFGGSNGVVVVNVQFSDDTIGTATATFKNPAYSNVTGRRFPKAWAAELVPSADKLVKKIISIGALTAEDDAIGAKVVIMGVPSLSTFQKIPCKTQLNWDPKVPEPVSIQCGRDKGAFTKGGEIPEGAMEVSSKVPSFADSLVRYNGLRVTGLIKEIKEDKLGTMNVFVFGLIMTAKPSVGEGVEPATLSAMSKYEDIGIVVAQ